MLYRQIFVIYLQTQNNGGQKPCLRQWFRYGQAWRSHKVRQPAFRCFWYFRCYEQAASIFTRYVRTAGPWISKYCSTDAKNELVVTGAWTFRLPHPPARFQSRCNIDHRLYLVYNMQSTLPGKKPRQFSETTSMAEIFPVCGFGEILV